MTVNCCDDAVDWRWPKLPTHAIALILAIIDHFQGFKNSNKRINKKIKNKIKSKITRSRSLKITASPCLLQPVVTIQLTGANNTNGTY